MIDRTIACRKDEHLALVCDGSAKSTVCSGFDDYRFEHCAFPETDFAEIDTSVEFLGRKMHMPLIISPITGGGDKSAKINKGLAELANDFNLGFSVGSQRVALEDESLEKSFKIRDYAPNVLLFANIGAVQLNYGYSIDECRRAVDMIDADALILHLNPLQEIFQSEGNTDFSNLLKKIERICSSLEVAVGVKEVGCGISASLAKKICDAGVQIIDIAGAGSVSWPAIESSRSNDVVLRHSSNAFLSWGNPTIECLRSIPKKLGAKIIASGSVKTGVDMAKALALGADICGNASDFLRRIVKSRVECENFVESLILELKAAMFCTGSKNIQALKSAKLVKIN
ncbi:MAG: type 2 isopentenyl-diphosphate Delta-isomerase [Holosporaceae bacterium]|nr:type 2 isopentenyl-diphosphate Delta-isomerase [Holosporaceae bacterium]